MFLDLILRRNPALVEQAIALHQAGRLPANAYVIDLDAVERNARVIAGEAARHGLKTFAMTKQMGRNAAFCRAVARGGIAAAVAVDMECARACRRAGLRIGHLGHLVQIPARRGGCGGADGAGLLDRVRRRRRPQEASAASAQARPQAADARAHRRARRYVLSRPRGRLCGGRHRRRRRRHRRAARPALRRRHFFPDAIVRRGDRAR